MPILLRHPCHARTADTDPSVFGGAARTQSPAGSYRPCGAAQVVRLIRGGLVLAFACLGLTPGRAGIAGGPHDFSATGGGYSTYTYAGSGRSYTNACQVCHIPHKTAAPSGASGSGGPLWNHHPSLNSSYVTYDQGNSATFNSLGLTAKLGSSVACLSCHDGSVAVNQSYTENAPTQNGTSEGAAPYYAPTFAIETASSTAGRWVEPAGSGPFLSRNDLTHMHPIGVSYTAAAARDPWLKRPASSGSLLSQMLKGPTKTVECATCHDIHGVIGASGSTTYNLIVDLNHGALCATCHEQ